MNVEFHLSRNTDDLMAELNRYLVHVGDEAYFTKRGIMKVEKLESGWGVDWGMDSKEFDFLREVIDFIDEQD